ncbi:hypothetical protein [Halomarina pelagica]|uniref:hypothetical protein n=1 Tax=Halomarina pelagica TaxID=2961599 RepID=UPI0020C250D6|nr:hypothetical protein [Halomarina sp. BND7]
MVSKRTLAFASSLCLLLGALLVGDALHGAVVTAEYAITSPAAVFRLLFGVAGIALGRRWRVSPEDRLGGSRNTDRTEAETGEREATGTFDPERSPLDEASVRRLAERERDRGDGG